MKPIMRQVDVLMAHVPFRGNQDARKYRRSMRENLRAMKERARQEALRKAREE